jgi:hypothetical protein
MNKVLLGRNLLMEQQLTVLRDAMARQLPRHLQRLPRTALRLKRERSGIG